MFTYEHTFALVVGSDGTEHLMMWYADDLDVFTDDANRVTYTRVGPIVKTYEASHALRMIKNAIAERIASDATHEV